MLDSNQEILQELKKITKLLIMFVNKDEDQTEKIRNLSSMGFQPKEIAEMIGTTANTVSVTINRLKKKKQETNI